MNESNGPDKTKPLHSVNLDAIKAEKLNPEAERMLRVYATCYMLTGVDVPTATFVEAYRKAFNVGDKQIERALQQLVEHGFLKPEGDASAND